MTQPAPDTARPQVRDGASRRNPLAKWLFLPLRWVYKLWFVLVFVLSLLVLYIPFRVLLNDPSATPRPSA